MGARTLGVVERIAAGSVWTPAILYHAAQELARQQAPRRAKQLHLLAAIWAVNHPGAKP